jgi:hypothetical protein
VAVEGRPTGASITPDTRWMTYREMANFLSVKEESARRRAQREGWPRQLGNDGRTRVGVPGDAAPDAAGDDATPPGATVGGDDRPGEAAALRAALDRERERAGRAEARANRAEGESATLREQVESERSRADRAETRAAQAEREREAAKVAAAAAEREAVVRREAEARERQGREAAERELAEWTAGGPLARALRALAFRRGRVP